MQILKHKNKILLAACVLLLLAAVGLSISYLTDEKEADNVVTVGDVELELTEEHYPQDASSRVMYSNSTIPKDPKIVNTGSNSAYVYMLVTVPKAKVTLLKEDGTKEANKELTEIFNLISTSTGTTKIENNITYSAYDESTGTDGWIFLGDYGEATDTTHTYVFAYSKALAEYGQTTTLFDEIQLKSFIEGEAAAGTAEKLQIQAYGIQSDNMDNIMIDLPDDLTKKLKQIYNVYANQDGAVTLQ